MDNAAVFPRHHGRQHRTGHHKCASQTHVDAIAPLFIRHFVQQCAGLIPACLHHACVVDQNLNGTQCLFNLCTQPCNGIRLGKVRRTGKHPILGATQFITTLLDAVGG